MIRSSLEKTINHLTQRERERERESCQETVNLPGIRVSKPREMFPSVYSGNSSLPYS